MNIFIDQFEQLCEEHTLTEQLESELLDHILDNSLFTDSDAYAAKHIDYNTAEDIVLSNDNFLTDLVSAQGLSPELVTESIRTNPEQLAWHLAYSDTEVGTQLLDELLYYRSKGRI